MITKLNGEVGDATQSQKMMDESVKEYNAKERNLVSLKQKDCSERVLDLLGSSCRLFINKLWMILD